MRLLLVTTDFPPDIGGTQTYACEFAKRFLAQCDDFAVVAPYRDGCEAVDMSLPFDVVRVRATPDSMTVLCQPHLLRLARSRRFDTLFHVQWTTAAAGLMTRVFSSVKHVYVAAHGRELLLQPLGAAPFNALYDRVRRSVLCRADGLFPVSNYTAGLLKDLGVDKDRIFVAPGGVDVDRFSPCDQTELRQHLGLTDRKVILTVCRLVPHKGVEDMICALPQVRKTVPETVYLVVGSGHDRQRLEGITRRHGVEQHVRFLGRVPDEELPAYYNLCDVFVLATRDVAPDVEGFGLVFLEAAACGKPAVGTIEGGIPDAILDRRTGLLVESGRPNELAKQLVRLLGDAGLAERLGENARQHVLTSATWDRSAARILNVMNKFALAPETASGTTVTGMHERRPF